MKRIFDIVFSSIAIIIFFPILLGVYVTCLLTFGKPVIFKQKRIGLHNRSFTIFKFRTMTNGKDSFGDLLPDGQRITRFGRFLRHSSLDELPELFNVFRGDMSLVGPRPLLVEYLDHYTQEQIRRHNVLPGITGWAQVNGRNAISWQQKFDLDIWYIDNWTLLLDVKILFMTIWQVLNRKNIKASDHATMPKFSSSENE